MIDLPLIITASILGICLSWFITLGVIAIKKKQIVEQAQRRIETQNINFILDGEHYNLNEQLKKELTQVTETAKKPSIFKRLMLRFKKENIETKTEIPITLPNPIPGLEYINLIKKGNNTESISNIKEEIIDSSPEEEELNKLDAELTEIELRRQQLVKNMAGNIKKRKEVKLMPKKLQKKEVKGKRSKKKNNKKAKK